MALDTTLHITLHRAMGLKPEIFSGLPFFRISTMEVTLNSLERCRLLRKSKQADMTSPPTKSTRNQDSCNLGSRIYLSCAWKGLMRK